MFVMSLVAISPWRSADFELSTDFRQFELYLNVTGLDVRMRFAVQTSWQSANFYPISLADGSGREQLFLPHAKGT